MMAEMLEAVSLAVRADMESQLHHAMSYAFPLLLFAFIGYASGLTTTRAMYEEQQCLAPRPKAQETAAAKQQAPVRLWEQVWKEYVAKELAHQHSRHQSMCKSSHQSRQRLRRPHKHSRHL
jgi:hypothetical protein